MGVGGGGQWSALENASEKPTLGFSSTAFLLVTMVDLLKVGGTLQKDGERHTKCLDTAHKTQNFKELLYLGEE